MNCRKIIFTIIIGLLSHFAFACSCTKKNSVKKEIEESDFVALVKVIKVENIYVVDSTLIRNGANITAQNKTLLGKSLKKVTVKQLKTYKSSENKETVIIYTSQHGTACGFQFKENKKYIVYANKNNSIQSLLEEKESIYSTSTCKRTKEKNKKEMEALAKYKG